MDLNEARKRIPQLAGFDDHTAFELIRTNYYPDVDATVLAQRLNYTPKVVNAPEKKAGILRTVGDLGLKLGQGVVDAGSMAVGAANLASGGLVGKGLRSIGYDPQAANQIIGEYLSDDQKQAEANVAQADGFVDSVVKHIENPRAIMGGIAQSAPAMLNSMAASRAVAQRIGLNAALATTEGAAVHAAQLQAGKTAAQAAAAALNTEAGRTAASIAVKAAVPKLIGAGAAIEGLQTAGKIADDAQAAGREYSDYALPALGAGAITSAISLGSGKLFGDAATEIATGAGAGVKGGVIGRGAKGFATEGGEEAAQSYSEQVFTNIANGEQDITKGASAAAGAGFIIGGAQGGGMAMAQGRPKVPEAGALSRAANIGIDAKNAQTAQAVDLSQGAGKFTGMDSLISAVQNDDNPSLVREIAQRQVQEQINQPESIEGVPANFAELLQQSNQRREQERIETRESWESAKEQAAIDLAEQDRIEQENRLRLPAPDMPMPDGALIDDNGTLRPQTYADAAMSQAAAAQREELGQSVPYGERGGVENVSVPSTPSAPEAPTYILHPSGKPFTNKIGAQTRLKQLGGNHTIVPYEGGYAIKSNESQPVTQGQEQQAATGVPEATAGSSQSESAVIQSGDIMHPSGKPFTVKYPAIMTQRQSGGEIIKVDGGYIVRPPKQPSLEEIIAESQSEPTYEKGKTGAETARNKLDAENPFLSFLGKYGLNIDERSDVGGERGKARLIPGHGPLFRKNGLRLDELAQMAKEAGFLSQEQIDSETDNGGVNALSEMIGQALNNEVVPKVQNEPEVNPDVEMLNEATRIGLDVTGKTPDQVYDMVKAYHDQALPPELNEMAPDTEDSVELESGSGSVELSPQQDQARVDEAFLNQSETSDKESIKENAEIDLANSDFSDAEYDDVPFSRAPEQKSKFGFDVDELQPIIDEISSTWKNAPKINVVQTVDDLPFDTPNDVRGAYYKKQVYLVAANLRNRAEAEAVLFHETLGHAGLNGLFGNDLAPALRSIAMKNRKIAEAAAVWRKNNTDIKGKRTDDQYHLISIEEALADYVGTGRTINGIEKLLAAIQKGLRAIGLNSLADWMENATDAEVLTMLASARNHIEKGSQFSVFGEQQAQVFSRQQSESEFFKEMGIETGATPNQESQYFNEVSWKTYRTDEKTGFPTWASKKLSLQTPRDVTYSHDVFYVPQNGERAVKYDIHDAKGKKVGYTVIELDGDMPKQLLDIEIDKDQRGNKHAENTVAALAADAGELGIWRIVDSARSWWDRIGTRTVDEYDGTINFKDYADARASREDKSGLGKTVGKSDDPALFSRAETNANATAIDSTIKDIAKTAIDTVSHKMADYRGLGLSTLGRRHLLDIYSDIVPQLKEYNELVQQMDADKNDAGAEADQIATKWGKLADEKKLAELMHDSTLNQIDPSKDYVPGDNRAEWSRLSLAYKSLSADAKDVFQSAAKTYNTHFMKVREAIRGRIERSEMTSASKTKMLERMDADFFSTVKGVYFPLSRFGQYVVIVKNKSGETVNVSRAETLGEAEATQKQLRRDLPASEGYQVGKILKDKEFNAARDAVGRGFLKDLFGVLEQEGGVSDELQDAINQLYLSSMPDLSWAKHGIHRKGTPGFSQDARRAFAQNVFHGARYLAKLKYADRMQMSLVEMQLHVDSKATDEKYDSVKAQQVVDEMNKRHDSYMNPASNPLSTALTSFGFVFHLGLSPASALVNLSQTALVAYPVMGAKWGYSKSAAQLLTASKEAAANKNDIRAVLKGDELKAYDAAVSAGVIDVTQAHDLAGISQGEDSKVMWKIRPIMKWASFLFHHAEKFNRQVTFIAAYRLSRQTGASHEVASAEATKATYDGHFDYSAGNRPRIMQGNVAKVLFLFKQYGQNMVYTLSRQAYLAMKGQTAEERTQARKALGGLLAMHASAAGVLGLPLVNTLLAAASMLGSDDDEPWDAEIALRNMLADVFGKDASEVISKGFSRLTPWDISGRVGLDKLIFPDIQEGLEGQRLGESAMAAGLGPVAGIGINMLKGLQTMSQGQYTRGLEEMMPAALRNPMKAVRYAREGAIDKSGIPIREDIGAAAIAGQALGFSPSDVQITSEGKRAIRSLDAAISHRRSELLRAHTNAVLAGDNEAKLEHRQDIAEFNKVNPTRKITQANIASSIRETKRRKEGAKDGVYLSKSRASAREAGAFAAGI